MLMARRMRRPGVGIVGAAVGTAVIAGTAGAVRHHQDQKYAAEDQAANAQQQAAYDAGAQAAQAQEAAAPPDDNMAKLQKLAELHTAGVLSDEEFSAAK